MICICSAGTRLSPADWMQSHGAGRQLLVSHGDGPDRVHELCAFDVDDDGRATRAISVDGLRSTDSSRTTSPDSSILDVTELEYITIIILYPASKGSQVLTT